MNQYNSNSVDYGNNKIRLLVASAGMVAVFVLLFGGMIWFASSEEESLKEAQLNGPNLKNLTYFSDPNTGLCYASAGRVDYDSFYFTWVPCSPSVLAMIKEKQNHE